MLIGLSAKKQCGKNTVCTIIKAIDLYYNCDSIHTKGTLKEFVLECLNDDRLGKIAAFRNIESLWQERSFACNLRRSLYAITGDNRIFAQDEKTKEEETTIKSLKVVITQSGSFFKNLAQKWAEIYLPTFGLIAY